MSAAPPIGAIERAAGDAFVAGWLGVPFAWDGRGVDGIDCWGLVVAFHSDVLRQALPDWRRGEHSRAWIAATLLRESEKFFYPLAGPADGCIALAMHAKAPHHVGIVWRGSVLHACTLRRSVIYERVTDFVTLNPHAAFGVYAP